MGKPYKRKDSPYWWIAPMIEGVQRPQSSGTASYDEALDKLQILQGEITKGLPITHRTGRCRFTEIADDLKRNYAIKKRASKPDVDRRLDKHLVPFFGGYPIGKITTTEIEEYIIKRQGDGARDASINRELAALRRAFVLATRAGKAAYCPHIEMLQEDNAREGFFEEAHYHAILKHGNPLLGAVLGVAYITGWRIKSILRMEWRMVDLQAGRVSLMAFHTKNRKAVTFPLQWGLREIFQERRRLTDIAQQETGQIIPYVFHREGKPVRSVRKAWEVARGKAGVPGRIIHDFRRTAVRNLLNVGVPLPNIMDMVGFKTLSMLKRYAITADADIQRVSDLMGRVDRKWEAK